MRFLVTGANGFLGSYIVQQLLKRGYEVRAMTRRRDETLSGHNVENVLGDVRDIEAVVSATTGIDTVIHTAAISGIWGSWKKFHSTNTIGTRTLSMRRYRTKSRNWSFPAAPASYSMANIK